MIAGVAGGMTVPDFDRDFGKVLPFGLTPFRPSPRPWEVGLRPPSFSPATLPVLKMPSSSLITPAAVEGLPWLRPMPQGRVALFDLVPPPKVLQIDAWQDPASSPIGGLIEDYEKHLLASAVATLSAASAPTQMVRTLPMEAAKVVGALRRGAKITWTVGRKAVVKMGQHVLGPVGWAGDAWDLYRFIRWAYGKTEVKGIPTAVYQPASNSIEFTMADGAVVVQPAWQLPEYVKYRY